MMDDAELVRLLRNMNEYEPLGHDGWKAADRIEALIAERDRYLRHLTAGAERIKKAEAERDAARDAALEEAAKAADDVALKADEDNDYGHGPSYGQSTSKGAEMAASAIRALKGKSHE